MLALVAMLIFVLAAFKVTIGSVSMLYLGLAFLAAHAAFGGPVWYAWPTRRSAP